MNMRRILEAAASLSLAAVVGCAGDVGTIDRTQPNALDKTMFEGIWYHRATVVGATWRDAAEATSVIPANARAAKVARARMRIR